MTRVADTITASTVVGECDAIVYYQYCELYYSSTVVGECVRDPDSVLLVL